MAAADLDGDGKRRGRRHDDQHVTDRVAGVRLRRQRPPLAPEGRTGDLVAALQPTARRRQRRDVQRGRQPRVRRVRRERRRSGTSTTIRSSRSSSPSTTTRSTSSTTTGRRCSPRRGSPTARAGYAGRRLGWGQFIRWLEPDGRGRPVPPPRRRVARRAQDAVAAVDRVAAGRRRPRRRRHERGDRPPQRRAQRAVRHAGVRVHGARRRPARRRALGDAARGLRRRSRSRRKPAFRPDGDWYPPSGIPAPTVVEHLGRRASGDRRGGARRLRLRDRPDRQAAVALRLRARRARRRSPPRSSPPT